MERSIAIIGLGQLGELFARGFLRCGHPVVPVMRHLDPEAVAAKYDNPALVLVAVGERDLPPVLAGMPAPWRDRVGLLQNELLPPYWQAHGIRQPTTLVVWFEKKPHSHLRVLRPTEIHGPASGLCCKALEALELPCATLNSRGDRLRALVLKNVTILTMNIAGLAVGGTLGALWNEHRALTERVAREAIAIQAGLAGEPLEAEELIAELGRVFSANPDQKATGRSAPERLDRARAQAKGLNIPTPELDRIQQVVAGRD
jgi:hypothetical protein